MVSRHGVDAPGGNIGGPGLRVWVVGSGISAIAAGVELVRRRRSRPSAAVARAIADWASIPALLAGGLAAELLERAEEVRPFATGAILTTAVLVVALPAIGSVAALTALGPPERSTAVMFVNASALVLGAVLFALWTHAALA